MIRKTIFSISVVGALAIANSCSDSLFNCVEGNGVPETEFRSDSNFFGIVSAGSYEVYVIYDTVYSIYVTADENILPYIKTVVKDGDLIVKTDDDRCLRSETPIVVEVRMPVIDRATLTGSGLLDLTGFDANILDVDLTGSGDIEITNIISNQINLILSGSGEVYLDGEASRADLRLTGSGYIDADRLITERCTVTLSGSGDVDCYATEQLVVDLSGSGSVYFSGSPDQTIFNITGSGAVVGR
jgi:hypothetical protein